MSANDDNLQRQGEASDDPTQTAATTDRLQRQGEPSLQKQQSAVDRLRKRLPEVQIPRGLAKVRQAGDRVVGRLTEEGKESVKQQQIQNLKEDAASDLEGFAPDDITVKQKDGEFVAKPKQSAIKRERQERKQKLRQQAAKQSEALGPSDFKVVKDGDKFVAKPKESAVKQARQQRIQQFKQRVADQEGVSPSKINVTVSDDGTLQASVTTTQTRTRTKTRTVTKKRDPSKVKDELASKFLKNNPEFSRSDLKFDQQGDSIKLSVKQQAQEREAVEATLASLAADDGTDVTNLSESREEQLAKQAPVGAGAVKVSFTDDAVQTELTNQAQKQLAKQQAVDQFKIADEPGDLDATLTDDGVQVSADLSKINQEIKADAPIEGITNDRLKVLRGRKNTTVVQPESFDAALDRLNTAFLRAKRDLPSNVKVKQSNVREVLRTNDVMEEVRQLFTGETAFTKSNPDTKETINAIADELTFPLFNQDPTAQISDAVKDIARFNSPQQKINFTFGNRDPSQTKVIDPDLGAVDQPGQSFPVSDVKNGEQRFDRQLKIEQAKQQTVKETVKQNQLVESETEASAVLTDPQQLRQADSVAELQKAFDTRIETDALTENLREKVAGQSPTVQTEDVSVSIDDGQVTAEVDRPEQFETVTGVRGRAGADRASTKGREVSTERAPVGESVNVGLGDATFSGTDVRARRAPETSEQLGESVNVGLGSAIVSGSDVRARRAPETSEQFGDIAVPVDTPNGPRRLETILGQAGEQISSGIESFAGSVAETVNADAISLNRRSPATGLQRDVSGEETEQFVEGTVQGALELANLPATAAKAKEGIEFGVEAADETAAGRGGELIDIKTDQTRSATGRKGTELTGVDILEGGFAGRTEAAAEQRIAKAIQAFEQNPAKVGGQIVGSLAASAGAIGAASRFGGPRISRGVSTAIQPGEELAIGAARRGLVSSRTATLVPGVREGNIEETETSRQLSTDTSVSRRFRRQVEDFAGDERAQADLTGRSRSRSRTETDRSDVQRELDRMQQRVERERRGQRRRQQVREQRSDRRTEQRREVRRFDQKDTDTELDRPERLSKAVRRQLGIRQEAVTADTEQAVAGEVTGGADTLTELQRETGTATELNVEAATTPELRDTLGTVSEIRGDTRSDTVTEARERIETAQEQRIDTSTELGVEAGAETAIESLSDVRTELGLETGIESRVDTGIEPRVESGVEARQDQRLDQRTELRQEQRVEQRIEPRRELGFEGRSELRSETGFEFEPQDESPEPRRFDVAIAEEQIGTGFFDPTGEDVTEAVRAFESDVVDTNDDLDDLARDLRGGDQDRGSDREGGDVFSGFDFGVDEDTKEKERRKGLFEN